MSNPKLTIELVPETCWFKNVRAEVSQQEWDTLRRMVYKAAGYLCEICGGRGPTHPIECHENWHYDDENKVQTLVKMVGLCPNCHTVKHIGLAARKDKYDMALRHLCRVNGWSEDHATLYVLEQFSIWRERSQHKWTLDISSLADYGVALKYEYLHPKLPEEEESPVKRRKIVFDGEN